MSEEKTTSLPESTAKILSIFQYSALNIADIFMDEANEKEFVFDNWRIPTISINYNIPLFDLHHDSHNLIRYYGGS